MSQYKWQEDEKHLQKERKVYTQLLLYNTKEWRKKLILGDRDWNTSEKEATKQQEYDNEQCDIVSKIKLVYKEIHIKKFRATRYLNGINTRIVMVNRTSHIDMGTKVINSFKSEIHQISGEILDYIETLILPPFSLPV